jgi:hypothetical protein
MSQMDSITETLEGHDAQHKFEVFKLDPLVSLRSFNILKEALAPALSSALGSVESLAEITEMIENPEAGEKFKFAGALERLLLDATTERIETMISAFMPVTQVDGQDLKGKFSLVFRGDLPLMLAWLKLCMKGEWGNVLGALASGIGSAIAQAKPPEKSPST